MYKISMDVTFTQMKSKKRIERHGEQEIASIYKYYTHIENTKVMGALDPDSLTKSQKRGALCAINLIKGKSCGKLKGGTCADGRSQRW